MTEEMAKILLEQLKPIVYLVGFSVVIFVILAWLFREQLGMIVLRLLPGGRNESDDDEFHNLPKTNLPMNRREDKMFDEVITMWKRCVEAQEQNAKHLAENVVQQVALIHQLESLASAIDSIAKELRTSIAFTNRRIDEVLLKKTVDN